MSTRKTPCVPPGASAASSAHIEVPRDYRGAAETLGILRSTLHAFGDDPRVVEAYRVLAVALVLEGGAS